MVLPSILYFRLRQTCPRAKASLLPLLAVCLALAPPQAVPVPRPRAAGYTTNVRTPYVQGVSQVAGGCVGGGCSAGDFNPLLLQGARGNPGIKARFNQRAFQYASDLLAPVLNQEIKRARLPNINQCIQEVNGCIQVYNLFVARYRCPSRIVAYPAPPNRVVLSVQNLDIGVDGNLGGQVVVLLPLALSGIVHVNAHQLSLTVELTINRAANGAPYIHMSGCVVTVGYVDAWIENGGLIGDIVNSQFRSKVSQQVKEMMPSKICQALPGVINEKINPKLGQIPQAIAVSQMLQMLGLNQLRSPSQCPSQCRAANPNVVVANPLPAPKSVAVVAPSAHQPQAYQQQPQAQAQAYQPQPQVRSAPASASYQKPAGQVSGATGFRKRYVRVSAVSNTVASPIPQRHLVSSGSTRTKRQAPTAVAMQRPRAQGASNSPLYVGNSNLCAGCPGVGDSKDPLSSIADLAQYLDMSKLRDLYLTVQLVNNYASFNDYTIELNGEFSPLGRGGTPFGAFPMFFPPNGGNRMAEALISDYTVNSLFYHMHRKGFLSFHVGPETPKVGELLKTTCSDDEDDLEDHGVEVDDTETTVRRLRRAFRVKRQDDDTGSLSELGICFGDILPAIREKYPNKKIALNLRTVRAPSILFSSRNGGMATLDLISDADIYIDGTNQRVGTITIAAVVEIRVQPRGQTIAGSLEITSLKLADKDGTLGLPQDALDNLGNLGKELLQKVGNDALQKGIPVQMPANSALPINFINPQFAVVEHALYLQSDFTVAPSLLAQLGGGSTCGGGYGRK
uniref:BPI1 domain-containing protein n=1 Tax=Steinernema glaseri TaxID=37863 RepID=A0A1I7ZPT9_9BILA